MDNKGKAYVYAAFFLALGIMIQSLRLVFPMIPGPVNMLVIGSLVNMVLLLAMLLTQHWPTIGIGFLLPVVAFLQGQLPVLPMILVVGMGNAVFMLLVRWLWQRPVMWLLPVLKAGLLYSGTQLVITWIGLPDRAAAVLSLMMGVPQIFTGCLGIWMARFLLERIRNGNYMPGKKN